MLPSTVTYFIIGADVGDTVCWHIFFTKISLLLFCSFAKFNLIYFIHPTGETLFEEKHLATTN